MAHMFQDLSWTQSRRKRKKKMNKKTVIKKQERKSLKVGYKLWESRGKEPQLKVIMMTAQMRRRNIDILRRNYELVDTQVHKIYE